LLALGKYAGRKTVPAYEIPSGWRLKLQEEEELAALHTPA
jgi:hypothetical protein